MQSILIKNVKRCLTPNSTLTICRYSHSRKTHYDTLNLKSTCTNDEIRHAFAKLSKEHHPDTSKTNNTENSAEKFQKIMEAYRTLKNRNSRDAYDAKLSRMSKFGLNYVPSRMADYEVNEMMRQYRTSENYRNTTKTTQDIAIALYGSWFGPVFGSIFLCFIVILLICSGINRNQRRIEDLRMRTNWIRHADKSSPKHSQDDS